MSKFCKDCKHFAPDYDSYTFYDHGRCMHPKFQGLKFSYVSGQSYHTNEGGVDAEDARRSKKCGKQGLLWEKKPPRSKSTLLGWLRCS